MTELIVVNKIDVADPAVVERLRRDEPHVVLVSALTGEGLDELRHQIAELLPRPDADVSLLVPYDRGDVVSRVHEHGEVLGVTHTDEGTRIDARVPQALAGELAAFALLRSG